MKNLLFDTDEDDFMESFIDICVDKKLFFTATPRIQMYEPVIDITLNNEEYEIIDDENTYYSEETHCGKMVYEYIACKWC